MLFVTNYSQYLTLPVNKIDPNLRKNMVQAVTKSCLTRDDFIREEYQAQHDKYLKSLKAPKRL